MNPRPTVLVTNDDGIESHFLAALVRALREPFEVLVAAPAREQSWIGRAMSRHAEIRVEPTELEGSRAWAISGTPTDCVNLAFGHLLGESRPVAVVSGINIGYNTTMPLIYSSGTIAGALEGAQWGCPAVAVSLMLPPKVFNEAACARGVLPPELQPSLEWAARHTANFTRTLVGLTNDDLTVHNLNFPVITGADTPLIPTEPARTHLGSLYEETAPGIFRFRYTAGPSREHTQATDRGELHSGRASHSILRFERVGRGA